MVRGQVGGSREGRKNLPMVDPFGFLEWEYLLQVYVYGYRSRRGKMCCWNFGEPWISGISGYLWEERRGEQ